MDETLATYTIQHLLINKKTTTNKTLYTTTIENVFTTDNEKSWKKKKPTNKINKQKQKQTNKTSRCERMKDGKF